MKMKKTMIVCPLLAAMLAVQTSCGINGGVIGYVTGNTEDTKELELGEPRVVNEEELIPVFSDIQPIDGMLAGLDFRVRTAGELILAAYCVDYVYTQDVEIHITLLRDIDLSPYLWHPMGSEHYFRGEIDGNGHTIKGLTIRNCPEYAGFIGRATTGGNQLYVHDINFTDVSIEGGKCVGAVCAYTGSTVTWDHITVTGDIKADPGAKVGAIAGDASKLTLEDCRSKVRLNGEPYDWLRWDDYRISGEDRTGDFDLTADINSVLCDIRQNDDKDPAWVVMCGSERVFEQPLEDHGYSFSMLGYDSFVTDPDAGYEIFIEAEYNGERKRCSNIVEYPPAAT